MKEIRHRPKGPPTMVSMNLNKIVRSPPWHSWQQSAIAPAAFMQRDQNASPSQIGTPIYFAVLLLFNLLTDFPLIVCMCRRLHCQDGPKLLFQTYGFVAPEASEEDKDSAAAEAAAAAAAAAEAAEAAAEASSNTPWRDTVSLQQP
jgi:hypothetical protein